jgi:hypothetical protein
MRRIEHTNQFKRDFRRERRGRHRWTLPVASVARLDADAATLTLTEAAVRGG